jgi:hypothetical protein
MRFLTAAGMLFLFSPASLGQTTENLDFRIDVPVDCSNPESGRPRISYELGASFSPQKPTVFIIADAQQFYVRKGTLAQLQSSLLDSTFNVVGIIGRDNNEDLKKLCSDKDGNIDWIKAYQVFSWEQYVNDINEVRKKMVGNNEKILLYGQSGGGFLVHQYLIIYGQYIDRAFTAAAVNYQLDHESGINHDRFWDEVTKQNSEFAGKFSVLSRSNFIQENWFPCFFKDKTSLSRRIAYDLKEKNCLMFY